MEIVLVCLYAGVLLHVSRRETRAGAGSCSFYVNNRASGAIGVALSLLVSCVGASATMGMAGMAFSIGTPAFWWLGAGALGLTLLALLLAAKVRESGSFTMPEMVERLLGKRARSVVAVIIVAAWLAILAAQFTAIGALLAAFTGLPRLWCLGIGFFLIVIHTLGGQAAVMRADRMQCVLLLTGLAILFLGVSRKNPEWTRLSTIELVNGNFGFAELCRYLFIVGGNYLVCPMLFGRLLSARDAAAARRGGLLAGMGLLLCGALIVAAGLACRGLVAEGTAPDAVLTTAILAVFPRWLAGLVLLTLISAVVSSADSCLVTAGTVASHDLLRRDDVAAGRACVGVLGAAGVGLTFFDKGILQFLFWAYDMYVSGVVVPVFMGLLLSGRRRPTRPGYVLAAIAVGSLFGCFAAISENAHYSFAGMAAAAGLTWCGFARARRSVGEGTAHGP